MIIDMLKFFGKNEVILGIVSLTGIIGFVLTIFVSIRTSKISKILKHNQLTSQYNKERLAFQRTFEGHRNSIIVDGLRSNKLLKDVSTNQPASLFIVPETYKKVVEFSPDEYGEYITRLLNLVQSQFPSADAFIDDFLKVKE